MDNNSFPVIAVAVTGILATAFLLLAYYLSVTKSCHRFPSRRRPTTPPRPHLSSAGGHPSRGLDAALIRSIPLITFRKISEKDRGGGSTNAHINGETASYECAVCLSEFEEGERLRVIPNCCHAFHVDCIDVWLQASPNCPLCRSSISPSSILRQDPSFLGSSNRMDPAAGDNFTGNDDDEDYVVIEIQGNNLEEPRLRKQGRKCSMGDEWIDMNRGKDDEEFRSVQPIRRSVSLDLSGDRDFWSEIRRCSDLQVSEGSVQPDDSNKFRRSIFSFGYGRNSRGSVAVQPVVHLGS